MAGMTEISIVICCVNCQGTIEQACRSAQWADELIVIDSGSDDGTAQIAQKYADRFMVEPWRGHTGQKRFAADICSHDWVFFLDGDEECSAQLASELASMSDEQIADCDLLLVPRRNYVMGRYVRSWWPDYLTRIFHRRRCTWTDQVLHDTRTASHPSRVRKLRGWLIHKKHSEAGFADYFSGSRLDERLLDVARQMHRQGRRCSMLDLILRPMFAFIKFFVLKRGLFDGSFGLLIAQKAAVSTQLKYAALWAVQHGKANTVVPVEYEDHSSQRSV